MSSSIAKRTNFFGPVAGTVTWWIFRVGVESITIGSGPNCIHRRACRAACSLQGICFLREAHERAI
jgi:hypothetical protein